MNNGYSICLNEWALDKKIKNELGLLLIISSLCAEKGYCWASNQYLAELFQTSEEVISRKLKKLKDRNYIVIEYEKKGCEIINRTIQIAKLSCKKEQEENNPRLTKKSIHDYQKSQSTIDEKVKENIISNNITSNNNIINNNNRHNIYNYIEEKFCRLLSPTESEKINNWLNNYDEDILRYAVDIAKTNKKSTFAYVEGILKNWKGKEYTTLEQIKEANKNIAKENEESYNELLHKMQELEDYDWLNDDDEENT